MVVIHPTASKVQEQAEPGRSMEQLSAVPPTPEEEEHSRAMDDHARELDEHGVRESRPLYQGNRAMDEHPRIAGVDEGVMETVPYRAAINPNHSFSPSETASKYLGKKTPENTKRNSQSSMQLFAQFVLTLVIDDNAPKNLLEISKYAIAHDVPAIPGGTGLEASLINLLLQGRDFRLGMDRDCLLRLRYFLIEFSVHYVSKKTSTNVSPSSMMTYMRGINRRFDELGFELNIHENKIINDPNCGLRTVLENRFAEQQADGVIGTSHNVLTVVDIEVILESEHCNPDNSEGFRNRLIFGVGLSLGARPTELWGIEMRQIRKEKVNGTDAFVYYPKVGSLTGESKNRRGGINALKYRDYGILIHDIDLLGGRLNVYKLVDQYLHARKTAAIDHPRFFLGVKPGKKLDVSTFFKPQPIGRNTMSSVVKKVCKSLGIRGQGCADHVTSHGLRATMISMLISGGYSDAAVMLRSGHRESSSLLSYHNLRGKQGQDQLSAIFKKTGSDIKPVVTCKDGNHEIMGHSDKPLADRRELTDGDTDIKPRSEKRQCVEKTSTEKNDIAQIVGISGALHAENCTINVSISK